jgi:hypothetical protein
MKRWMYLAMVGATVFSVVGCSTVPRTNEQQMEIIRPRAAFEMRCPGSELTFTPLADVDGFVYQYGVEGCGLRAVYVREGRMSGPWYANTVNVQSAEEDARRTVPVSPVDQEVYNEDFQDLTD